MCNALGCSTELVVVHEARKKLNLYRRKFASDISSYHECFLFFFRDNSYKINGAQDLGCLSEPLSVT